MRKNIILISLMIATLTTGCSSLVKTETSDDSVETVTISETETESETVTETETETTTTEFSASSETIETISNETAEIVNGCILADAGTKCVRAMEQYYYNEGASDLYTETLEEYYNKLGGDVNVYSMIVPTSQAFYTPDVMKDNYKNQGEAMAETYAKFKNVTPVNIYDMLDKHKDEYIYSRSDYHWQPLGAFYASYVFSQVADLDFADISSYTSVKREDYLGSFYSINNISALADYPDTFTYYKPANLDRCTFTYYNTDFTGGSEQSLFYENNSTSSSYTVFVGRDETILEADTDANTGRTLVIFKDSYGNALVPFLTSSFDKIYLCDFRYFNLGAISFIQDCGATDLLFAMGAPACNDKSKVSKLSDYLY